MKWEMTAGVTSSMISWKLLNVRPKDALTWKTHRVLIYQVDPLNMLLRLKVSTNLDAGFLEKMKTHVQGGSIKIQ